MPFSKNTLIVSPWPYRLVRIGLGMVFVWAGLVKLMDPRAFARVISGYGLLPENMLVLVAVGLPLLELFAGTGLIFDVRGSLRIVFGLVLMFLCVLGFAIVTDLDIDCGCFSAEELHARNSLRAAFVRDLLLLAGATYLFFRRRAPSAPDHG